MRKRGERVERSFAQAVRGGEAAMAALEQALRAAQ
jgi:hypothetical protein